MKRFISLLCLLMAWPACALNVSPEGRQEAALFDTFVQAMALRAQGAEKVYPALQKALALSPDSNYLRRLLVATALAMGKLELAEPYLDYINAEDNEPEDYMVYANYQVQKGNTAQGLEAYEKALALAPDNTDILYQYLLVLSGVDLDKTVRVLEKTAQEQPELAAQSYTQIGRLYMRRGDKQKALPYLDKAIAANKNDPAPRLLKADYYEKNSQFFLMLHEFEELEKIGYANAGVFSRMAAMFVMVDDLPKAKEYFLKAKAVDNTDAASNYFLAMLAERDGNFAQAISYLKDASDYPTNAAHWLQVSFWERKLDKPQASLQTLAEAYKKFPESVEVGFFYGLALNDDKQYRQAARVLKKVLQARPEYTLARLHYAYALESLQKYKEMETQTRQVLEKEPQNAPALNLLAYSLAERNIRLDEAEQLAVRAVEIAPNDVSFQDTLGWVYIRQGKLTQAEKIFSTMDKSAPERNPEIAYHLGALRYEQGRPQEALPYLEMARTAWPPADKLYKKISKE